MNSLCPTPAEGGGSVMDVNGSRHGIAMFLPWRGGFCRPNGPRDTLKNKWSAPTPYSGGLGVGGSNPLAPTIGNPPRCLGFSAAFSWRPAAGERVGEDVRRRPEQA
jgi:hypothetical protein